MTRSALPDSESAEKADENTALSATMADVQHDPDNPSGVLQNEGQSDHSSPLYYVGIGASAGGLEALRPFVANLPEHANMTYIVAQHMSPDHRSLMVELLARETRLKVVEASNNLPPEADTIYVAPPNADITVSNGRLMISSPTNTIGPKPSVDRFFISLADDRKDWAIGIILSGTGSDGAHGIKAIKAAGGISIAQEPQSAKYDSMPNAAIRIGRTDLVLPPPEIANQLHLIVQWPRTPLIEDPDDPPSTLRGILRQIAAHTGMDFSNYKDTTLSRQIQRRMTAMQIPSLEAYGEYIAHHHEELAELASNFLICVTSFFRDPEAFEGMRRCLKEVLRRKQPGDDIRIWTPGCATGEEVYSIAILLAEELGTQRDKYRIQLFATDINGNAVTTARSGIYPEAALSEMDSTLIGRYFTPLDGMYHIDKRLRDMTLFARQDLVQDAPFVRLDMVSCRNLLIYFKPELQERVIKVFHYALNNQGILFLGKSESIGRLSNLYIERDRKNKIYLKRPVSTPVLTGFGRARTLLTSSALSAAIPEKHAQESTSVLARDRLFELYAPAALLMTDSGEIIELFGDCGSFLSVRKGKADFNAFSLIRTEFRAELRAFAHRVVRTHQSTQCNPVELPFEGKTRFVRMAVHYAGQSGTGDPDLLLVCFEAVPERSAHGQALPDTVDARERIQELEQELVLNRENLQTVIEELETANEELQSLNEEAQAANEELQASNEELETANEELQASNEELITVNDELNTRTQELGEANNDLSNILNSLHQGVVVVDRNLVVTRFNQVALEYFDIVPGTRPALTTISTRAHLPELLSHVGSVLKKGHMEEFEITHEPERCSQVRLLPYHDGKLSTPSGVVITIADITDMKRSEERLKLSASVFEHAAEATLITDAANRIISVNPAFTAITGYGPEEVLGQNPSILSSGKHPRDFYAHMWEDLASTGNWAGEIQNRRKNGTNYVEWLSINVLKDDHGNATRHIAVFSDISDAKKAQETIEHQAAFDALTGLPNRNLIMDRLKQMLSLSRRNGRMFAVMFMDLDHFKSVNDALGHAAGDELLINISHRIRDVLRDTDSVGRMGGDEFILLLDDVTHVEDVIPLANKILAEVHRPLVVAEHTLQTATSIGITIYPMDGDSAETLLKNADSAMYEAKTNGRNNFCFFTQRMQDEANRRHWIDTELSLALRDARLELHYQPIVRLDTHTLVGAEALMRWKHPARGYIPPSVFIPVAEQNGTIHRLSEWALERGLQDWQRWTEESGTRLSLSFNLSVAQFVAHEHIEQLIQRLCASSLAQRDLLMLEITESLKLADNSDYVSVLHRLRESGCRVAIDDFGSGYSSLSYLKRVPVDVIKIDQSFVRDITTDPADAAMVRAILQMAAALGLETIAEGVETQEQLDFLYAHGCRYAQGFLFSQALSIDDFAQYAQTWQTH